MAGRPGSDDRPGQAVTPDRAERFARVDTLDVGKSDQADMSGDVDKSDQADTLDLEVPSEEFHRDTYCWTLGTQSTHVVEDYIVSLVAPALDDSAVPVPHLRVLQPDALCVVVQ